MVAAAVAALLAAPATASADVIFDQADAEELAATLDEAHQAQGVCYGWHVDVDNVGIMETSEGSNFGAGVGIRDAPEFTTSCDTTVEFQANIRWTSETSEMEDSASYQVESLPEGPTTSDLDSLELISEESLVSDNVDVAVYKAVSALPLLAADAGVAEPLEASPAPPTVAEGAQPTNSPGSDLLRDSGGAILFGVLLLLAGGVFAFWALRTSRGWRHRRATAAQGGRIPEYVPPDWSGRPTEPGPRKEDETPPEGSAGNPPAKPTDPETRPEG